MSNSLKLAALFLWVVSAIFIKEDAKQKIKEYHPLASYEQKVSSSERISDDSVAMILTRVR